jgi:hypothetical protein
MRRPLRDHEVVELAQFLAALADHYRITHERREELGWWADQVSGRFSWQEAQTVAWLLSELVESVASLPEDLAAGARRWAEVLQEIADDPASPTPLTRQG